ncbi:hypothetical protein BDW42DRAFT_187190 [Aspergillus taichungensis]|uniref:Uncharacterized protein n=1 Tax=Aspergillus taichungensis TaxID=482145 RepID=A0A2J5HNG2_9EURO|nr:hypothetical protein BDW42DRAFT_187190 [Aspergillus taichungensis]
MSRNRRAQKPNTPRMPNTPRAPNTQREQLEPSSVAKRPRTPMTWKRWNHRRDRQVLLAIFAQTNMKVPNFKELSEILGGEEYSVDMLRRRFIYLCEMAEEYREERQEVAAEMGNMSPKVESGEEDDGLDDEEFDDDVVVIGEISSPPADTPLPCEFLVQSNPCLKPPWPTKSDRSTTAHYPDGAFSVYSECTSPGSNSAAARTTAK